MKINDVRHAAYAMHLTNPAFPRGPYRFFAREYQRVFDYMGQAGCIG